MGSWPSWAARGQGRNRGGAPPSASPGRGTGPPSPVHPGTVPSPTGLQEEDVQVTDLRHLLAERARKGPRVHRLEVRSRATFVSTLWAFAEREAQQWGCQGHTRAWARCPGPSGYIGNKVHRPLPAHFRCQEPTLRTVCFSLRANCTVGRKQEAGRAESTRILNTTLEFSLATFLPYDFRKRINNFKCLRYPPGKRESFFT